MTVVEQQANYLLQCASFAFAASKIAKQDLIQAIMAQEGICRQAAEKEAEIASLKEEIAALKKEAEKDAKRAERATDCVEFPQNEVAVNE